MNPVDWPADLGECLADVLRAHDHGGGVAERLGAPRRELGVAAHRVLELRPVHRDRVARPGCRSYWAAEEDVAGEDEVGRQPFTNGRGVVFDPRFELAPRELLHELDPVAVVLVEHEHRQQAVDVRAHRVRAAEVETLGMRLL